MRVDFEREFGYPLTDEQWQMIVDGRTDEEGKSMKCSSASNFTNHANAAISHLLYPPWQWAS